MKIEAGKRYVRRDGNVSGIIESDKSGITGLDFPFRDEIETYSVNGEVWLSRQSDLDLIAEYKESQIKEIDFTKPLRIVKLFFSAKHIGRGLDAMDVVQYRVPSGTVITVSVDKFGRLDGEAFVENIPEKLVMWVNFYEYSAYGYPTREEADDAAGPDRLSCVRVECDEGEGL